jgi:NitT/TauT family transport system permease protein
VKAPGAGLPRWLRWSAPGLLGLVVLGTWESLVILAEVPVYVLPAPSAIARAAMESSGLLIGSAWHTLRLALLAFLLAVAGGVVIAVLFSQSRVLEAALYPYAVVLQVTPVVAIAPLILIWVGVDKAAVAVVLLAWIVAFFPILSNMTLGLRAVDPGLRSLFRLYGGSRWQELWRLRLPAALPWLLSAMKVSAGLSLVGVVVAEFVAGSGTSPGLAWRIIEAGNRLQTPRMFAALLLLALIGILLFALLAWLERRLLARWHDSAR